MAPDGSEEGLSYDTLVLSTGVTGFLQRQGVVLKPGHRAATDANRRSARNSGFLTVAANVRALLEEPARSASRGWLEGRVDAKGLIRRRFEWCPLPRLVWDSRLKSLSSSSTCSGPSRDVRKVVRHGGMRR